MKRVLLVPPVPPKEQRKISEVESRGIVSRCHDLVVRRHNLLIESRHRLGLTERRFMLWIISQTRRDDDDFHTYIIRVKDWEEFIGIKPTDNTYNEVYKMANNLTKRNVGIRRENGKGFEFFTWFHRIAYIPGTGTIEARINPELKPYLLQLREQYTSIQLQYALLLRREVSFRFYDLLRQYYKIGSRTVDLKELREMLELENSYSKYTDFRRYVLERAQKEVNEKTDISFDFNPIKKGNKVTAILFIIYKQEAVVTLANREEIDSGSSQVFQKLKKHEVAEKTARELIADYDNERIEWHIKEFERRIKNGEKKGVGWLINGIKTDYRPQQSMFEKQEEERLKKAKKEREKEEQIKAKAEKLQKECGDFNAQEREKIITELSEEEKIDIFEEVKQGGRLRMWGNPKSFEELESGKAVFKYELYQVIQNRFLERFLSPLEYAKKKKVKNKAVINCLEFYDGSVN